MIVSLQDIASDIAALLAAPVAKATAIRAVSAADFKKNPDSFVSAAEAAWLSASGWVAKPGAHALLPGVDGLGGVILALGEEEPSPAAALPLGALPAALPEGTYTFVDFPGSPIHSAAI
jgi:leucyl aminopeptidase